MDPKHTNTWPDLAIGLYERQTAGACRLFWDS